MIAYPTYLTVYGCGSTALRYLYITNYLNPLYSVKIHGKNQTHIHQESSD